MKKKLAFLVGTWAGDATTVRPNQKIKVRQTEDVSYSQLDRKPGVQREAVKAGRSPQDFAAGRKDQSVPIGCPFAKPAWTEGLAKT